MPSATLTTNNRTPLIRNEHNQTVCKSNKIFKTSPFLKNSKHKTVKKLKKILKTKKNFLQKN